MKVAVFGQTLYAGVLAALLLYWQSVDIRCIGVMY